LALAALVASSPGVRAGQVPKAEPKRPEAAAAAAAAAARRKRVAGLIAEYLGLGKASAEDLKRIAALVKDLGDNDFARREAASQALVKFGPRAVPALREAAKNKDPEVAQRAAAALERIGAGSRADAILDELWALSDATVAVIAAELAKCEKAGTDGARERAAALKALRARLGLNEPGGNAWAARAVMGFIRNIWRRDARRIIDTTAGQATAVGLFVVQILSGSASAPKKRFASFKVEKRTESEGFVILSGVVISDPGGAKTGSKCTFVLKKVAGRWRITFMDSRKARVPAKKEYSNLTVVKYADYKKDPEKAMKALQPLLPEMYRAIRPARKLK
jgi:hypothetical protein